MSVFVPPPILDEMQAVFHLPVAATMAEQVRGSRFLRVNARNEKACFEGKNCIIGVADNSINTNRDAAVREIQLLAYEFSILQIAPEAAFVGQAAFFSII